MSEGRFNYFNIGPSVVMQKPRYRDDDLRHKNTYNFVTDPRLKRGRNYGIVYVSSTAFEDNDMAVQKLQNQLNMKQKPNPSEELASMGVPLPAGLESIAVETTEVPEFLPKPITYEIEVQTQDYIDRPQTPLFNPVKYGEDKSTQIEKGELFDFDEEVEPIINVLTYKVLEESRMEVLEEEELKEMKRQEQEFEKVRNRELEIVQKLENQERRRNEEKERRTLEREMRMKMSKIYQEKLISCVFAKNYINPIKNSVLSTLEDNGVIRKPEINEYTTIISPNLHQGSEMIYNEQRIIDEEIINMLNGIYCETETSKHKQSVLNEKLRLEEIERVKHEEIKKIEDEKLHKIEEREKRRYAKEIGEISKMIYEMLYDKIFTDDVGGDVQNPPIEGAEGGEMPQVQPVE